MKFKFFIFFLFFLAPPIKNFNQKKPYSAKGFAYIYNEKDFKNKIIKRKIK